MEIAARLDKHHMALSLQRRPREVNQEADDLSNMKFDAFDLAKRVPVDLSGISFLAMPEMLVAGSTLYTDIADRKHARKTKQVTEAALDITPIKITKKRRLFKNSN